VKRERVVIPPKPDLPIAEVINLRPKPVPSVVIGVVREMRPTAFVAGWPPPEPDDDDVA
jgi:hypothetical protein